MGAWPSKGTPSPSATMQGWSDLPPEMADLVLRRLPSLADRLRFAAVCRHWLNVVTKYSAPNKLPGVLPWLNFKDGCFQSLPDGELLYVRFRKRALCIGSFGSWLLFEEATGCDEEPSRRHFLMNPLRKTTKRLLPGHCMEPVDINPDDGSLSTRSGGSRSCSTDFSIGKLIVCSGDDLVVAMVKYRQRRPDVVVCCRPGVSPSWSAGLCNGRLYQDMALCNGKLYTVTEEGHLFAHELTKDSDTGEPRVSQVERVIRAPSPPRYALDGVPYAAQKCVRTCYLVISKALKVLMVRWIVPFDYYTSKDPTKRMAFKVFEADFDMSRWVEVKSLDGQVLFVSSDSSRAFSGSTPHAPHSHCLQGNKIYFVDDGLMFRRFATSSKPRTCGVYDMSSGTIQSISTAEMHVSDQSKASWFYPHDRRTYLLS